VGARQIAATGPFSEVSGAITTEEQSYSDDDIASASGQQHDTQTSSPGAGVTVATDDQSSGSTSKSYHDSGDRDQTATGTTDDGSDTSIEHDTSSLSQEKVSGPGKGAMKSCQERMALPLGGQGLAATAAIGENFRRRESPAHRAC